MNYPTDQEAKEMILDFGKRMYQRNFVASNDGNISCKVAKDTIWATPTGVSKGFMEAGQLVKMKLDGTILEQGELSPSSEIKMHIHIYRLNPEAAGVTHAHPPLSTAFANAGLPLDDVFYPETFVNLGIVPCAPYKTQGTDDVPESLTPYVKDYSAVLMGNHGVVTWGRTLTEAFYRLESVEGYAAQTILTRFVLGKVNYLNKSEVEALIALRAKMGLRTDFPFKTAEDL